MYFSKQKLRQIWFSCKGRIPRNKKTKEEAENQRNVWLGIAESRKPGFLNKKLPVHTPPGCFLRAVYYHHEALEAHLGCPRKWHFGIPRNTEVISGSIPAKFCGIPRNFAEFRRNWAEITSEVKKFRGIPCRRNSVDTLGSPRDPWSCCHKLILERKIVLYVTTVKSEKCKNNKTSLHSLLGVRYITRSHVFWAQIFGFLHGLLSIEVGRGIFEDKISPHSCISAEENNTSIEKSHFDNWCEKSNEYCSMCLRVIPELKLVSWQKSKQLGGFRKTYLDVC